MSESMPEYKFEEHVVAPRYEKGPNDDVPEADSPNPQLEDERPVPPEE